MLYSYIYIDIPVITHTHTYIYILYTYTILHIPVIGGWRPRNDHPLLVGYINTRIPFIRPCPSRPCPSRARRQWSWQRRLQCRLCTLDGRWSPSSIRMAGAWYQVWIQENTPQEIVPCQPLSLSLSLSLCNIDNNVNSQVHQFITGITLW
jgi:hypothetical protein